MNQITFSQAVEGYLLAANARHLSPHTLDDYLNTYRKFELFLEKDPPIANINSHHVEEFLKSQTVSKKTILNYHTGLSALWAWAVKEELVESNIVHKVERVKPEKKAIAPYSHDDIQALLSTLNQSKKYRRPGKRECSHSLPQADRNRAIIYLLLDTGLRASELCKLRIHEVDIKNQRVKVMGKGTKERILPFSARTGQVLWKYLAQRKGATAGDALFISKTGRPLTRMTLLHLLIGIGERAGVKKVNCHRFRHTFAINYLRNGGDPWSLQMMLGHSSMETVKIYLALAQADLEKTHKIASPVDNWRL